MEYQAITPISMSFVVFLNELINHCLEEFDEIFNLRIMCRQCNDLSGVLTPYQFAIDQNISPNNSIALNEQITTLLQAVESYY